ncbi:membrane protein involved in the export of O-antigen and teichoic acid [Saccharomonospora marina XMU15]|uniref:Membrane protein involved in the export of O-antigen and teichoic acid n=2 Tax=Saccharomonospora TaxID=1851 RepID=H5WYT4_9PSEU|nr:membrane protein involved in the export of O-antigen and teichoic acid [Saccharomonospora marina XMU15]
MKSRMALRVHQLWRKRELPGAAGVVRNMLGTALVNMILAAFAAATGVVIARALGPTGRGEYAAIFTWFSVVLAVGQLGQTAATTYFVARHPKRAPDYLATSRNLMVASGVATLLLGIFVAPLLASGNEVVTWGYRLMFLTCLACFVGASYTFSLQATNLKAWNMVRVAQPVAYLSMIVGLHVVVGLSLMTVLAVLSFTMVAQTGLAYLLCRREGLTGGTARRTLTKPLTRYGVSQLMASTPTVVTTRLDQLVLSIVVPAAQLGRYAVAASLSVLAAPLVAAIGHVAFPRIASRSNPDSSARLRRDALLASTTIGAVAMILITSTASWVVPTVFGPQFSEAVPLVWLMAPGGVFLGCGRVSADLLRGHGKPGSVACAQGIAAVATVSTLVALLPIIGIAGAAVAWSTGTGIAFVLMLFALRRVSRARRHTLAIAADADPTPVAREPS